MILCFGRVNARRISLQDLEVRILGILVRRKQEEEDGEAQHDD